MSGSCRTVIPSTPGAPLLRTTTRNAASMLFGSQIASIRHAVSAGLSGSDATAITSTSRTAGRGASPRPGNGKSNVNWNGGSDVIGASKLLALSFNPSSGTVRAFGCRSGLLCPLLTSVPRSGRLAAPSVRPVSRRDTAQISWVSPAAFLAHPPDLQPWPLMDMDFATSCPLVRPMAASYPVAVRQVAISLHASFRRSLAVPPLRFTRASPPSGCTGDFHPQAAGHAQHTGRFAPLRGGLRPSLTAAPRSAVG